MTMPPIFHTKRLLLRPPAPDDSPSYQRHFADYEVIRHLSVNVPWPFPSDGVLEFINAVVSPKLGHDYWFWVICLNHDRETVIGAIDLWRPGHPENRGFWLGREFWGQGYMTEAVAPVMDHAFDALGFDDVILSNAIGNDRSRRIKEKTGAVLLGSEPASFVDPVYTEHEIWQLTKAAWIAWRRENPAT